MLTIILNVLGGLFVSAILTAAVVAVGIVLAEIIYLINEFTKDLIRL